MVYIGEASTGTCEARWKSEDHPTNQDNARGQWQFFRWFRETFVGTAGFLGAVFSFMVGTVNEGVFAVKLAKILESFVAALSQLSSWDLSVMHILIAAG